MASARTQKENMPGEGKGREAKAELEAINNQKASTASKT